jgi:hypothetical protein
MTVMIPAEAFIRNLQHVEAASTVLFNTSELRAAGRHNERLFSSGTRKLIKSPQPMIRSSYTDIIEICTKVKSAYRYLDHEKNSERSTQALKLTGREGYSN